eukprot:11736345-Alexandrium_andersonii.AAC.1
MRYRSLSGHGDAKTGTRSLLICRPSAVRVVSAMRTDVMREMQAQHSDGRHGPLIHHTDMGRQLTRTSSDSDRGAI